MGHIREKNNAYSKDCPGYEDIPTFIKCRRRIIAIGDVHGDLDIAVRSFKIANLIDNNNNWIAEPPDTVVVQVGDQLDNYRPNIFSVYDDDHQDIGSEKNHMNGEDVQVMDFFDEMHRKASKQGGGVYSLLGNHEILNVIGRYEYVSRRDMNVERYNNVDGDEIIGPFSRNSLFSMGTDTRSPGPLCEKIACSRPAVLVIGDIIFVHAGILPNVGRELGELDISDKGKHGKLKKLNRIMRKWILGKSHEMKNIPQDFMNNLAINQVSSPFWTRAFGIIPADVPMSSTECSRELKKTLKLFNLGKMVIGHTPQKFGEENDKNEPSINGTCYEVDNDKVTKYNTLYRIDGGFSMAFDQFRPNQKKIIVEVLQIMDCKHFTFIREKL